jgi:hypothetical protein
MVNLGDPDSRPIEVSKFGAAMREMNAVFRSGPS